MLKKACVVVATTAAIGMVGAPAFAATTTPAADAAPTVSAQEASAPGPAPDWPTFGDAFNQFVVGGGAAGYGAASLVAGAYTGIATTPALIAHSFGQ